MKLLAQEYHCLPSDVLRRTPAELYFDLMVTYPPDTAQARPPRQRQPGDPSISELIARMQAGVGHNGHG